MFQFLIGSLEAGYSESSLGPHTFQFLIGSLEARCKEEAQLDASFNSS